MAKERFSIIVKAAGAQQARKLIAAQHPGVEVIRVVADSPRGKTDTHDVVLEVEADGVEIAAWFVGDLGIPPFPMGSLLHYAAIEKESPERRGSWSDQQERLLRAAQDVVNSVPELKTMRGAIDADETLSADAGALLALLDVVQEISSDGARILLDEEADRES